MKFRIVAVILALMLTIGTIPVYAAATFYYVVTTVDTLGLESAYSTQATATLAQGQHQVSLTWIAPTVPTGGNPIAGYNVYRGTVSGGPYTKINATLVTTGLTYVDPFVPPNAPPGLTPTSS